MSSKEEDVEGGRIEPRIWYLPYRYAQRRAIEQAFYEGEAHVDLPGVTQWVDLRSVVAYDDVLIEQAYQVVKELQRQTPMPMGYTREQYAGLFA